MYPEDHPFPEIERPIQVSASTLPAAGALRYLLVMLGTFAVGHGWVDAENVEGIVTVVITIGTAIYGLYRTWDTKAKLVVAGNAAPDSVVQVK